MTRLAWALFFVLAAAHTWPLVRVLPSHAADMHDTLLNVWQFGAIAQQLATDPLHPLDVNMYYPFEKALTTLDQQLASGAMVAPVTWVSGNPVLGHNVFLLATFVFAGVTMFLLVRELTGSAVAGIVAGCIYSFAPFRLARLPHSHILSGFWLPLLLLWVHRYTAAPRWGRLSAIAALLVLHALSSWYFAAFGMVAATVVGIGGLVRRPHARVALMRAIPAAAIVMLLLLPLALSFARVKAWQRTVATGDVAVDGNGIAAKGMQVIAATQLDIRGRAKLSAELQHYARMSWMNRLWKPLRESGFVEGSYFPGAIALGLAVLGVFAVGLRPRARPAMVVGALAAVPIAAVICAALGRDAAWPVLVTRRGALVTVLLIAMIVWSLSRIRLCPDDPQKRAVWSYLALMAGGVLLSCGPQVRAFGVDLGAGVYPAAIPPFGVLRVAARFGVLYTVGLAVLAGFGAAWLMRRMPPGPPRGAAIAAGLLVINLEHLVAPIPFSQLPRVTPADSWLRNAPAGAVVVFPIQTNPWGLLGSLHHRKPIVNGSGAIAPPPFMRLNELDDLSADSVEHLKTYFHPRYVVLYPDFYVPKYKPDVQRILDDTADEMRQVAQMGNTRIFEMLPGGRGPQLVRWYHPRLIAGKTGVAFRGRIEAPRPDLEVTVTVSIDGHERARWPPGTFVPGVMQFVAFRPSEGHDATVEIAADYAISEGAQPLIGGTGVRSPANVSIAAGIERTVMTVNNRTWRGEKGYTVAAIAPDGRAEIRRFNTSWSEEDSHKLAEYVGSLPRGRIVAIASHYDVGRHLTAEAVQALHSLGFREDLRGRLRGAHAGVGVKGAAPGTALECTAPFMVACGIGTPARVLLNFTELRLY